MDKQSQEKALDVLLEDFTKYSKRTNAAPKTEINYTMSCKERAIRAMELLAKQEPVTLSQARAQALNVKIYSGEYKGKKLDESIKYDLRLYFSKLSEEQINDGLTKLYSIYQKQKKQFS